MYRKIFSNETLNKSQKYPQTLQTFVRRGIKLIPSIPRNDDTEGHGKEYGEVLMARGIDRR